MQIIYQIYAMATIAAIRASITWDVVEKVDNFGETLELFCKPDVCCFDTGGWGKWGNNSKFDTIILGINDHVLNDGSKYEGVIGSNGFSLLIRNLSISDLNVNYSCTYGLETSPGKSLILGDVFKDGRAKSAEETKNKYTYILDRVTTSATSLRPEQSSLLLIPAISLGLIVTAAGVYIYVMWNGLLRPMERCKTNTENEKKDTTCEKDNFLESSEESIPGENRNIHVSCLIESSAQ